MSVILSFFEAKERILQTPSKKADPEYGTSSFSVLFLRGACEEAV